MSTIDGGPAFPGNGEQFIDGPQGRMAQSAWGMEGSRGMSLRDYFAAKTMQSIISRRHDTPAVTLAEAKEKAEIVARTSYLMADAMLAERAKARA